jgi:hypothetical protein
MGNEGGWTMPDAEPFEQVELAVLAYCQKLRRAVLGREPQPDGQAMVTGVLMLAFRMAMDRVVGGHRGYVGAMTAEAIESWPVVEDVAEELTIGGPDSYVSALEPLALLIKELMPVNPQRADRLMVRMVEGFTGEYPEHT